MGEIFDGTRETRTFGTSLAEWLVTTAQTIAALYPDATFEQRELLVERVAEALGCL